MDNELIQWNPAIRNPLLRLRFRGPNKSPLIDPTPLIRPLRSYHHIFHAPTMVALTGLQFVWFSPHQVIKQCVR